MRTPISLTTLIACVLLLALPAAAARANATDDRIVRDCQLSDTGELSGSYSKAQLRHALQNVPGDALEYSGCYDQIKQATLASVGGGGGNDGRGNGSGGLGGGSNGGGASDGGSSGTTDPGVGTVPNAPPPPGAERPLAVAGTTVAPGALPEIGLDSHRLPTALLVLLVLLGVAALATAALTIGRRVVARRTA